MRPYISKTRLLSLLFILPLALPLAACAPSPPKSLTGEEDTAGGGGGGVNNGGTDPSGESGQLESTVGVEGDPFPGEDCMANTAAHQSGMGPDVDNGALCGCAFTECDGTSIGCSCDVRCYSDPAPDGCDFVMGDCDPDTDACDADVIGDTGDWLGDVCVNGPSVVCYDEDDLGEYQECSISDCVVAIVVPPPIAVEETWCYQGACTGDDQITLAYVSGWSQNEAGEATPDGVNACIRATMGLAIVNTSYGDDSFHSWKELHHSDHLEIQMKSNDGTVLCDAIYDIFTDNDGDGSNASSLGISGGGKDGSVVDGDKCDSIVSIYSSMDYNWFEACDTRWRDVDRSPTAAECPDWQEEYWWEVCFTKSGLGVDTVDDLLVTFPSLHASPSTCDSSTVELSADPVACDGG